MFLAAGVPPEAGAVALSPTAIGVFENDTYQSAFSDFTLATPAPVTPADPDPTGGFGQSANSNSGQLAAQPVASPAGDDVVVGIALGGDDPSCPTSLTTVGWGSATGSLVQAGSAGALNDSATWPSRGFKLLASASWTRRGPVWPRVRSCRWCSAGSTWPRAPSVPRSKSPTRRRSRAAAPPTSVSRRTRPGPSMPRGWTTVASS